MTFRHSNELLLRIKAYIVHDLMLHYGMLIYLKPCRNFEKVDNVQTKCNETKKDVSIHFRRKQGKLVTETNQTEYKIRYHATAVSFLSQKITCVNLLSSRSILAGSRP